MQEIQAFEPTVTYNANNISADFDYVDCCIDELEKRYSNYEIVDKKEAKKLCEELNKVIKGLKAKGISIEKDASKGIKKFRKDLKEREKRVEALRAPIWDEIKPQKQIKEEPVKVSVPIKVCYLFEGDSNYISDMIGAAIFNDIKVTEVKL